MSVNRIKVHLVTCGVGKGYERSARRLMRQAKASGLFDSRIGFYENDFKKYLPLTLRQINEIIAITNSKQGFGLWFWKPDIILAAMARVPENEIVVYLDAGCSLNYENTHSIERFWNYIGMASQNGLFAMQLWDGEFEQTDLTDAYWGSSSLSTLLQIEKTHLASNQIQAGILFVRNCKKSRDFMEEWRSIMESDNFKYLIGPPKKKFRYDQSVFSLLYKKAKYQTIPDETYFYPTWKLKGKYFPVWATRINDGVDPFRPNIRDFSYRVLRKIRNLKNLWLGCWS
jgi:hypothetical protein